MARGPRFTPEQVEEMMVPKIVEAIYPVLFPMEQQDCRIQAENLAHITNVARATWREFSNRSQQ